MPCQGEVYCYHVTQVFPSCNKEKKLIYITKTSVQLLLNTHNLNIDQFPFPTNENTRQKNKSDWLLVHLLSLVIHYYFNFAYPYPTIWPRPCLVPPRTTKEKEREGNGIETKGKLLSRMLLGCQLA